MKCWNAEGDANFNTRDGIIPKALMAMITRVTSSEGGGGVDPACTAYDTQISAALTSIESVGQWLRGDINEYTSFSESTIPTLPTGCNPTNTIAEVREQKIDLVETDDFKEHLFDFVFGV